MNICFVILHYGEVKITIRCLQSIIRLNTEGNVRVVVLDNDDVEKRKQNEKEWSCIKKRLQFIVLEMPEQAGFSEANNIGYFYARQKLQSDFIVFANNDIEFCQKNFGELIYNIYDKEKFDVLGPDIIKASSGEHQNPLDIRLRTEKEAKYTIFMNRLALKMLPIIFRSLERKLAKDQKKMTEKKKNEESFYQKCHQKIVPHGACLIFSKKFIENEEKVFFPETKFYYEEYILAWRCEKKGYRILYDPSVKVIHENGKATQNKFSTSKKKMAFLLDNTAKSCETYLKLIQKQGDWN